MSTLDIGVTDGPMSVFGGPTAIFGLACARVSTTTCSSAGPPDAPTAKPSPRLGLSYRSAPRRPVHCSRGEGSVTGAVARQGAESRLRALVGELERDYPKRGGMPGRRSAGPHNPSGLSARSEQAAALTNLLERSLEEVRRRTRVIGRFPGETRCLTLRPGCHGLVIGGARGLAVSGPDRGAIAALVAACSIPDAARVA
jgi:hypothetical protein